MPEAQSTPAATPEAGSFPQIDYASHPAYGGMFDADVAKAARAQAKIAPFTEESVRAQADRLRRIEERGDPGSDLARLVASEGVARLDGRGAEFDAFASEAAPLVQFVRQRIDHARDEGEAVTREVAKLWVPRETQAPFFATATRLLKGAGILDTVRRYFGADGAKVRNLTVVVNRPGQSWHSRLFRDVDVETPSTTGMHIDTDPGCVLKTVIYLSEVGPEQGPFGCVPYSHLWEQEGPNRARRRACHKARLTQLDPDTRHAFASLPAPYQLKASFGGDIPAGSAEGEALLASEQQTYGPPGQLSLFDPEMMHRGGHIRSGERVVVLVGMGAVWSSPDA